MSAAAARSFALFMRQAADMLDRIFNITIIMTPKRTLIVCALTALFFTAAAALYDSSAMVDAPVKAWLASLL